jgi:2-methylcitrate dehydratase PrpD
MSPATTSTPAVTQRLAEFAVAPVVLPAAAKAAVRMTFGNAVGVMIGGGRDEAFATALATLGGLGTPEQCTLWGRHERGSMTVAALLGGVAAHVQDFDDTDLRTVIHAGAPIVPAALAVGEHVGANMGEVLDAVAVGVEITLRVGLGLGSTHFARGWHITGTTGRFGAAAAAGRLLGLSPQQMQMALGIAATEAAGVQAAFGTMTKSFHAGKAACDGVEAALLAAFGFTSAPDAIEGRRGLAQVMSDDSDVTAMLTDLGDTWELEQNALKPYACGIVSHPVIDAGIQLRRAGIRVMDVEKVRLRTNPVVLDVMGIADPQDGLQSKFSVYHCFAVGLIDEAGGPDQFSDERARDATIVSLRNRIAVDLDPSVARDECFASVSGARSHEVHVEHATGSKDRPVTREQLDDKMRRLAEPSLGLDGARQLIDAVMRGADDLPIARVAALAAIGR